MSICNFPILFGVCVYVFLCLCVLVNKCMCACQCLFNCTLYFIWERQTSLLSLLWDTCPFILPHLWFICPSGQVASTGRTSESCPLRGSIPPAPSTVLVTFCSASLVLFAVFCGTYQFHKLRFSWSCWHLYCVQLPNVRTQPQKQSFSPLFSSIPVLPLSFHRTQI